MDKSTKVGYIVFSLAIMSLGLLGITSNGGSLGQFGLALAGAVLVLGFCFLVAAVVPN